MLLPIPTVGKNILSLIMQCLRSADLINYNFHAFLPVVAFIPGVQFPWMVSNIRRRRHQGSIHILTNRLEGRELHYMSVPKVPDWGTIYYTFCFARMDQIIIITDLFVKTEQHEQYKNERIMSLINIMQWSSSVQNSTYGNLYCRRVL